MDNSEKNIDETANIECEIPLELSLSLQNNKQLEENALPANNIVDPLNVVTQSCDSKNQTSIEKNDVNSLNENAASETNSVISTENSMPPLPPLPNDDKGSQPSVPYSADYNMQNYSNYNYMYNYNNYYGYPYPQYQWDYNSQQYYQPYQNYYNYNYNANQAQASSKQPPPLPDAVQLPVEEKPASKTNVPTVDDSNRYSPTAETDDDDTMKGIPESKSDVPIKQFNMSSANANNLQTVPSEQIAIQQNMSESVDNVVQQHIIPSITSVQQPVVSAVSQLPPYSISVQKPSYLINPQTQVLSTEAVELTNQQYNVHALNGKDESVEKVSKGSTVLGKTQAKKRLMAFSMMKQKLQEQNNSTTDNQNSDIGEANDVEFVPELNIFQTVTKKKVLTNKKVAKVIKAQQTIEQIEEMKKDELLQGNNTALYQHLLRSGGSEAPILQKLGIESLAEKYSAKIREQDKRLKRHHHRRRDDSRRGHKYRRRSHSKSRSRSAEKPKMRALEVKSWKDFINGGFHFDKFRRFKLDETEEIKEKERKSRMKKRHGKSRSDGKNQNIESASSTETEKGVGDQKLRFNLLERKKEILKGPEVLTHEGDYSKYYPSSITRYTQSKPAVKFSENPASATYHLQNRHQMLATLLPEIESFVHKFLSSIKPKRLKDNTTDDNYNNLDDKLLVMMKDSNIYPFKGWWPKTHFIVCQAKEDPNVEIDKDALINEIATSKRTKKSRFNDDTSMIDIRPTVPSKWDSDYDGSPATDKVMDVEVSQNSEIISTDGIIIKPENNPPAMSCQDEESMDTTSDVGEVEQKVISTSPNLSQEPQVHAVLDTEYEKFLKIVSVEKSEKAVENNLPIITITNEVENNLLVKSSTSLNGDSEEDSSTKSSDEFASFHSAEKVNNKSFINRLSAVDIKLKKKKTSSKKSKKIKKKESKKMKYKSSSSESSQDSESESDSSSEDSDSETTHSTSSVEKKKYKSKDRKNKKSKKKHKGVKNKTKISEDENKHIMLLGMIEKALNVGLKVKSSDNYELQQKKKKRKHEKKEININEENDDNFENANEYLKKKLKTYDDSNVYSEVLKQFINKKKKSKKSFKRNHESDISDEEITPKKSRLDASLKIKDAEKKKSKKKKSSEKRSIGSEERVPKKKSKKKSKTTDSSETDEGEQFEHKKMKNEKDNFFGQRPNEWNMNTISSMRGVVHYSDVKNINCTLPTNDISGFDVEVTVNRSINLNEENSCPLDTKKNENQVLGSPNVLIEQRKNSESESDEKNEYNIDYDNILIKPNKCDDNIFKHKKDVLQDTTLSMHDNIDEQVLNIGLNNDSKQIQIKSRVTNTIQPIGDTISYRDKVKINLKKLSACQNIPFVFGFSSPLSLIKPTNLEIEKIKPNLKETNEHLKPVVDESTLSKFDEQKFEISTQTQKKNISPKIGIETNHEVFDSSLSLKDFEESVPSSWEYLSDERQNEQIKPSLLKNQLLNNYNDNQLCENDSLSNSVVVTKIKEHSFDTTESSSCDSDSENQNEKTFESDNSVAEREITTSSNFTDVSKFKLHLESNNTLTQNNRLVQMTSVIKDSDSLCPPSSNIDLEASLIDNELIIQWTSDWSKLNTSVTDNYSSTHQIDGHQPKKSRWDEPPKYDEIDTPKIFINEQNDLKDIFNNLTSDNLENINSHPKGELVSEEQMCEINSVVDETRNYSENWTNEYADDCSQSYEQCSFTPQYSKMKTIEKDKLIPVDYSVYENYNPNYNCNDEYYNKWKSLDTSDQLASLAITSETLSSIQVGNVLELLPSDEVSVDESHILKDEATNEKVFSINSDFQDGIVENEKSSSVCRNEQFFKLYQQHFQHYNKNPIKYSMSEPILDNITAVNIFQELPTKEKFNTHHKHSKAVSIPLQDRAYSCAIQDDGMNIYLTSDNYLAYCAVEDKCMVHIALKSSSRDGVGNEVRHCFNVNQNGSIVEYWLHADLIPFHVPSDVESGVFSDDDVVSGKSDSSQEDNIVDNNDYYDDKEANENIVEGKWEIIDCVNDENVDTWLDNPCILNKYGGNNLGDVGQTVTDINQEESVSSSSDYDTDTSDFSDSYFELSSRGKQNITLYTYQKLSKNKGDKNELKNIADAVMPVNVMEQQENAVENSDLAVKMDESTALSINLDSNIKIKNEKDVIEVNPELITKNNDDNILMNLEEKESCILKESGVVSLKEENVVVDDISMMETIYNQKILIKKLYVRAKEQIQDKMPDTIMVNYSDNMETVKYPFLGLFQPPTVSILSKNLNTVKSSSKMSKRVTFADGINPGDNLAASPTHNENGRPLSPPPIKALLREILKLKRNMYPLKKSKVRTKLTMVNKKVATVTPSIKTTTSVIEYYISRKRLEDLPIIDTFNNSVLKSDDSSNSDNTDNSLNRHGKNTTPPRPTRELTPVPSDSDCWYDDDNIKDFS